MSRHYLITGVAGSGKSTLEKLFKQKGHVTIDIDDGFARWRHAETDEPLDYTPDKDGWHEVAEWVVDTDALRRFFAAHPDSDVLVFGSFARVRDTIKHFDALFLLEYPDIETVRQRIAGRKGGYGEHPDELARIVSYVEPYQERMKQAGAQVLDCTLPLDQITKQIEQRISASEHTSKTR